MVNGNSHFQKLAPHYLFPRIEKQASLLPGANLINLGVGDATEPLIPSVVQALCDAAKEMGEKQTFKGYGPSQGYLFLRELIATNDYKNIDPDEIFISDGSKSDTANILEVFDHESIVAISDPAYPVYVDSTIISGKKIVYLPCTEENHFMPLPPNEHVDIIYLCSPNNPTGVAISKEVLQKWVAYAKKEHAVIIFDAAYEAYISSGAPHTIYDIEGAKEVAIEARSFSKTAGFTGVRCSYLVIPKELNIYPLWKRRTDTKFNGVSYIIQKGAAAIYSPTGKKELAAQLQIYKSRAALMANGLKKLGYSIVGGNDAPYIWCKTPKNLTSWEFFDHLLHKAHIIAVPGAGFGPCGEGYVRFSCFRDEKLLTEALRRLQCAT